MKNKERTASPAAPPAGPVPGGPSRALPAGGRPLPRPADVLPHRPPFLFVDKVLELEPARRVVASWTPPATADFFQGHFPGNPILPGVLLIEALAQTGAILVLADRANRGKLALFGGIDKARFRRQVKPGEEVRMELTILQLRDRAGRGQARAWVGEELAAQAELTFFLVARPATPAQP